MKTVLLILSSILFLFSCAVISDKAAIEETRDHIKLPVIGIRKPIPKDRN